MVIGSAIATPSETGTVTATGTSTATPTETGTATNTSTGTYTLALTMTATVLDTGTPMLTSTITNTLTATQTSLPATCYAQIGTFGTAGSGDGQFDGAQGVAIDAAGNVIVTDIGNFRLQKFTSTGGYLTQLGQRISNQNPPNMYPIRVAVDENGNIWNVTEALGNVLQQTNPLTGYVQNLPIKYGYTPIDVATDKNGHVFVLVYSGSQSYVQEYTTAWGYLTEWGDASPNIITGSPSGITANKNYVYVTVDSWIIQFNLTDGTSYKWQETEIVPRGGNIAFEVSGITADENGYIYVNAAAPSPIPGHIVIFDSMGNKVGMFNAAWTNFQIAYNPINHWIYSANGSDVVVYGPCGTAEWPTATVTSTPTRTVTDTPTPTGSSTATSSETVTATGTSTATPTETVTPKSTESTTATPTATLTGSATAVSYETVTDTSTITPTVAGTSTRTYTATNTPQVATVTGTATPIYTETETTTPTVVVVPSAMLSSVVSYPNPSTDGTANLSFVVGGNSSTSSSQSLSTLVQSSSSKTTSLTSLPTVTLKLFTRSGRLMWTHQVLDVKLGINVYHWNGRDFANAPVANGLYIYTVTLKNGGDSQTKSSQIFILK